MGRAFSRPVVFGEVLLDAFPDGRRVLGGAPFNVAWNLAAFGLTPRLVSRLGNDRDGRQIRQAMCDWSMPDEHLQTDPHLPTGRVDVRLADGEPEYEIVHPAAWDAIAPTTLNTHPAFLYHGSLTLRDARSAAALVALREQVVGTVFMDVNLRAPWFDTKRVLAAMKQAHWVKLNEDESSQLGFNQPSVADRCKAVLQEYSLRGVIFTRGNKGAVVATAEGEFAQARNHRRVELKSTVGAGDALSSVMILALALAWPLALGLERAVEFASAVCGLHGATSTESGFYQAHLDHWRAQGPD